jgi:hypothetical protein
LHDVQHAAQLVQANAIQGTLRSLWHDLITCAVGLLVVLRAGPAGPGFPCIVSTYEIVMADIKALARYNWKYVVVDEGHRLKNFECKLIRDLRMLPADNKLLLTGAAQRLAGGSCFWCFAFANACQFAGAGATAARACELCGSLQQICNTGASLG